MQHQVRASVQLSSAHHLWEEATCRARPADGQWLVSPLFRMGNNMSLNKASENLLWPSGPTGASQAPGPCFSKETELRQVDLEPDLILTLIKSKNSIWRQLLCLLSSPVFISSLLLIVCFCFLVISPYWFLSMGSLSLRAYSTVVPKKVFPLLPLS